MTTTHSITIEGTAAQLGQLAVTIRDGLFFQARDAAEDGEAFNPLHTFEAEIAADIEEQFT
jgi:hypothetical protein